MVVKKERAHPALDAHDDRSGAPSLRSAGDSNGTAFSLQASPNVTSSLLSMGNSSTARLRPALSAPLAPPPVLSGAVSPSVAAIGFWVSGGTAAYIKYGPHGKELDSTLKMVLTVGSVAGLLITSVMLYLIFTKDRALLRCLKQRNDFGAGGMAGLIFCLLFSSLPREMSMTVQIPESLGVMINLVPESYPVEMLSGLLISLCRLGMMLGTLLTYPLTSGRWHQPRLKLAVVVCGVVHTAALVVFAAVCYDWKTPTESPGRAQTARLLTLLGCQFIAGIVLGISNALVIMMTSRVTPPSSRPTVFICRCVLNCAGTGLGPMLSNAVRYWQLSASPPETVISPGDACAVSVFVVAVFGALWLASFVLLVPTSNDGVPVPFGAVRGPGSHVDLGDFLTGATAKEKEKKEAAQKTIFVTGLSLQTERAWLVAGLEVVTAMVLEQEYEISSRDVGFAIGSCFMVATPLIVLGALAQQKFRPETLLVGLGITLVALCVLIFHFPAKLLHLTSKASLFLLLSVDTIVYPAAQIVGGMIQGLTLAYAIIPGSKTYSSTVAVLAGEMGTGIGRFLSMPVSRLLVASGGRDLYAAVQVGLAFCSLLGCIKMIPALRLLAPSAWDVNALSRPGSRQSSRPPSPKPSRNEAASGDEASSTS